MEANSLIQNPQKKQRLNEEHDIDGNSRCLSNLPEEVLLHILSLLPTKDAARTSEVSKRWEYLWASMPNLVFDGSLPAMRTICFSNLNILTIKDVTFSDEYLTRQLFSGPPLLEKLDILDCSWGDLKVVTISAPKLHSLRIHEFQRPKSRNGDVCRVKIFAESLKEFYYFGVFSDYCLYKSFSLEKAKIYTYPNPSKQIAHRMYKLLKGLSNVQFLGLSCAVIKALIYVTELLHRMPMFKNLMDLKFNGSPVDLDCTALLTLLQKSPCLRTLNFFGGINLSKDDRVLNSMPPCFLSHLKCIKVDRFRGDKGELFAVKTLLKNAIVLDEIVITCSENFARNSEKQEKVYKELIKFPKRSRNCKIVLEQALPGALTLEKSH
ncbi:hypothetical protein FH972_000229 [Carpinus fangiana]|uniref:F-box domain-containing protein n=1 Tax=Carpinus fangiana TaxID=176857 RepID=A0A5N6Q884_9ROSI|nr:hypothetical protein FH972_000229 [Carpinus fangiana]